MAPMTAARRRERLCRLFDCYAAVLPVSQRETLRLRVAEDWNLQEIADAHGTTRQAVHASLRAAEAHCEALERALALDRRTERRRRIVRALLEARTLDAARALVRQHETDLL